MWVRYMKGKAKALQGTSQVVYQSSACLWLEWNEATRGISNPRPQDGMLKPANNSQSLDNCLVILGFWRVKT